MSARVLVGMSGGVDSSVAAALLVEQGFDVVGAYMKNWTLDIPGSRCAWADDLAFAKRTAVKLDIDFRVYDFQEAYKRDVVDYLVEEYRAGRTPNPDIMCNQDVKFGAFLDAAEAEGFDYIATGHYARTNWTCTHDSASACDSSTAEERFAQGSSSDRESTIGRDLSSPCHSPSLSQSASSGRLLLRAADEHKDQTYFLYRMTQRAVNRTLFPIGHLQKPQVREIAERLGLPSAEKPDSQGICFIGEAGIRDFLRMYVDLQPGEIIDAETERVLGYHDGAIFFTIGQRKGLQVGGGKPHFVVGKDMERNIVYVTGNPESLHTDARELHLERCSWIAGKAPESGTYRVRTRHTGALRSAQLAVAPGTDSVTVRFEDEHERVAAGQSAVIYDNEICLGGGIVS